MTNYITSTGVQYVAITIPTGAASATATIAAVGTTAFILNNGFESSGTTSASTAYCRIELTNSTTVTAYRNASDATITCVASACVVDATGNLIVSVQSGTIVFASGATSATATISSVDANNAVLHCLGFISSQASLSLSNIEVILTYSGTTVTATRLFSGSTETVGFIVIEFQGAVMNQAVQSFQKAWTTTTTSTTQVITSVNANNALVIWAGSNANSGISEARTEQRAVLTNGTTVTINVNTAFSIAANYNFFVLEFIAGVLNSNVQRGTTTLTTVNSNTSTITAVNTTNTLTNFLRYTATQTAADITDSVTAVALTNSTTVTTARNGASGNVTSSWEIAEFIPTAGILLAWVL